MADGDAGLRIIDLSVPSTPTLMGTYDTVGSALDVTVVGNYAYVADGPSSTNLAIIDVTTPSTPTLTGSVNVSGSTSNVTVLGNTAYFESSTFNTLYVYNVSIPSTPTLIASISATDALHGAPAVAGDYLYLPDTTNGFKIYDINPPSTPTLVGTHPSTASAVAVAGNFAYLADGGNGLTVLNVSTPASPAYATSFDTSGVTADLALAGNYAYLADGASGLAILKIGDYPTTGTNTFQSPVIDLVNATNFNTFSWSPVSQPANTTLDMEVRAGPGNDCPGACTNWTAWAGVTNPDTTVDTFDGKRYFQYNATLGTTDSTVSPQLNNISLTFPTYSPKASLVSSGA